MSRRPILSRALTLESRTVTPDGAGGFAETWVPLGTLWAEIRAMRGRVQAGSFGPQSFQPLSITLRGAPQGDPRRPRPDQRLREGARVFTILSVAEADAQGRYLICTAREEIPA